MNIQCYDGASEARKIGPDWRTWLYRHGFLRVRLVPIALGEYQVMLEVWKGLAGSEYMVFQPDFGNPLYPARLSTTLRTLEQVESFVHAARNELRRALGDTMATPLFTRV